MTVKSFGGALLAAVVWATCPGPVAVADEGGTYFDTKSQPNSAWQLRAGYDLSAGRWVGIPQLIYGTPVFCFVQDDDYFPPSNDANHAAVWRSEMNKPILYTVRPFGTVSFSGDCGWRWLGP